MDAYKIILKRSAIADLDALRKYDATQIADAMERHLQHDPTKESKSRIKRLRDISNPDYRLRVSDYRVFYVVDENARWVDVLRVMYKDQTLPYYKELKR
jgi:mRNA-degrading endonuclease RelE of RelBE toxin-antitoxin system